jgi:hypothetical protein
MMSPDHREKIRKTDALLIDEISMLDGQLFDVLECMIAIIRSYDEAIVKIEKKVGKRDVILSDEILEWRWSYDGLRDIEPWGGLQLIVVGDFYQLPPVPAGQDKVLSMSDEIDLKIGRQGSYAFESRSWMNSNFSTVELTEVHRQAENDGLYEFLNDMREGHKNELTTKHRAVLRSLQCQLPKRTDGIIPTEVHSKNVVVDMKNREELDRINAKPHSFPSVDEVALDFHCYILPFLERNNLSLDDVVLDQALILELSAEKNFTRLSQLAFDGIMSSTEIPKYMKSTLQNHLEELKQHCDETFFAKECRVADLFELKEEAQVISQSK